jgi:hypothetical protein
MMPVTVAAKSGIIVEIITSTVLLTLRILITNEIVGLNIFQIIVGVYAVTVALIGAYAIFLVGFSLSNI